VTERDHEKNGYKRPPRKSRFSKGRSGNPRGRPKTPELDLPAALKEALNRKVWVTEGDEKKQVSAREAIVQVTLHRAATGDLRAIEDVERLLNFSVDSNEPIHVWGGDWGVPAPKPED